MITGDVTAVISGGSIGNQSSTSEYPVSAIGGSYVKSTGNPGEGTPASTTAETGNISLSISGGTFYGAVFGGSVADNYGSTEGQKPILKNISGISELKIQGGKFESSKFGVFGGSAAIGMKSATTSSGSSVSINNTSETLIDIVGRVVGAANK